MIRPSSRFDRCRALQAESLDHPRSFWLREASALVWVRPPERAFEGDLAEGDVSWFADGVLDATACCVDRHAAADPARAALVWLRAEGDVVTVSYRALRQQMCRMANVLLAHGVRPQDRVAVYLPPGAPLVVALLGCARVGAVHLAVPPRAEPAWLERALRVARVRLVVTANEAPVTRLPLWERTDEALGGRVEAVLVHRLTAAPVALAYARDHDLDRALALARPTCPPLPTGGEAPLLLAAVAGDDGARPVVHAGAGFLLQSLLVQREVLGVGPGDRVVCPAGPEGLRLEVLYGALAQGATVVLDEREPPGEAPRRWEVAAEAGDGGLEPVWSSEGAGMLVAGWPGTGSTPLFGLDPVLVDARGAPEPEEGELCTRASWPAQPRTFEADHARYVDQRLRRFPGLYRTGERCRLRPDGTLVWMGRTREPMLVAVTPADRSTVRDRSSVERYLW